MNGLYEKDADRGLYEKYNVGRVDGRDGPDDPHHGCAYFVLDLDHDPHALPALVAYAKSCEESFFRLHEDLISQVRDRCSVWLYRVHFGGVVTEADEEIPEPRPPVWVFATDADHAEELADLFTAEPSKAERVPLTDFNNFVQSGGYIPTLMRCALYSAEEAEDRFTGFVFADGAAQHGEPRTAGALGE